MGADDPLRKRQWAERGLALRHPMHPTTEAMLQRQLYLAAFAEGAFDDALQHVEAALQLDVVPDVLHQDAARACQAVGDTDGAVTHLRQAARKGPANRRAFHHWTLGSVLFVAGRHEEAVAALERAARWGTHDKPLYRGHLALAKCRAGQPVRGLEQLFNSLEDSPAGRGYGRFVLGHLAYQQGRFDDARRYLKSFVERTERDKPALARALEGELRMARGTLRELDRDAS